MVKWYLNSFDLHFPNDYDVEHLFVCLLTLCISVQILCPFLYWVVFSLFSCKSFSYILDTSLLTDICFASIFSYSVGCLFVLFMVSFAVQKLLSLIRSHLFIFAFISITLGDESKKKIAVIYVKECFAYFSSGSFIVSGLTFRSLIHFEFFLFCFLVFNLFFYTAGSY